MNDLTQDQIDFLVDMMKTEGWRIYEQMNKEAAEHYRLLATQQPGAVDENMRAWYSAMARGRMESVEDLISKVETK